VPVIVKMQTLTRLIYADGSGITLQTNYENLDRGQGDKGVLAKMQSQSRQILQQFASEQGAEGIYKKAKTTRRLMKERDLRNLKKQQILENPASDPPPPSGG